MKVNDSQHFVWTVLTVCVRCYLMTWFVFDMNLMLQTDICEVCPNPLILSQQLTHIELERLSMIGPEEFVQAFAAEKKLSVSLLFQQCCWSVGLFAVVCWVWLGGTY